MIQRSRYMMLLGGAALALAVTVSPEAPSSAATAPAEVDPTCVQSTSPAHVEGPTLAAATATGLAGVRYDTTSGALELSISGGTVNGLTLPVADTSSLGCAGDFDEDGWTDFVASDSGGVGYLKLYHNDTASSPAPDWSDSAATRTPLFSVSNVIEASSPQTGVGSMLCADIDNDGHMDFLLLRCANGQWCTDPGRADAFLGNGNGTFKTPYQFLPSLDVGGTIRGEGTRMALFDADKDGKKDLVVGVGWLLLGRVNAFINNGATQPVYGALDVLVPLAGLNLFGVSALAIADFTGDGKPDIVMGGADSLLLILIPGTDTGFDGLPQLIPFSGAAVTILAGDFTLGGRADLIVATDGGLLPLLGFNTYLYKNDGDSQPFSGGMTQQLSTNGSPGTDFDVGFALDYDHDPQNTLDFIVTDGDTSGQYYVFANRTTATFVDCGTAQSGTLPTPELDGKEGAVTQVRISPEPSTPSDGTWTFEASNDDGVTWHAAPPCIDDATDFCSDVSASAGRQIRWRATMCSNATHDRSPELTAVDTSYAFVAAEIHFRAGPVMRDDVIYVGGFKEPGHQGVFMAIDNVSGNVLWEAGAKLDATLPDQRHIFTADAFGLRLDMVVGNILALLDNLNLFDVLQGLDVLSWLTSPRFGALTPHTLGGVVNSTAAVLSAPGRPYYYALVGTSQAEKDLIDDHRTTFAARQQLVFVGSQSGMLHAFYTDPATAGNPLNGKEAWGFVPRDVSRRLTGDKTAGTITAFVDGSPTLATAKIGGVYRSVLVAGEGEGGHGIYALDVTETIDSSSGNVLGPTFLWSFNDSNMGATISKPTIIRTLIAGDEKWLAVFASGPDETGDLGDTLYALDVATGALVWRFDIGDTDTYISTDITAGDEEDGEPDGYISRLYFGDSKGRMWKLDPTVFASGMAAPIGSPVNVGLAAPALFSTRLTTGALGVDRAISANIIAVQNAALRTVLYFGTGGTEETAPGETNAFYAVFADTGEIRSQIDITGARYQGASYQDGQIVFFRSDIPETAGLCVLSNSELVAIDATTFALQFFQEFEGRIASPVYSTGGEIFVVTMTGKLKTSTYTGNNVAGAGNVRDDTFGNPSIDQPGSMSKPFVVLGWRQTY